MLSVRQIQEWAATQKHESETDAALTTLLLRWTNEGFQEIASAENWEWLQGQRTFTYGTHGAGVNFANGVTYLPEYVHRPVSVWPSGRSYREQVEIISGWELDARDPSMISGNPADFLTLWGWYGVERDNPTAGVIVVADAGGSAMDVVIEGIDTNGNRAVETVTLVGGAGTSSTQFAAGPGGVERCYLVEDPTTITGTPTVVTFSSGGTQIERLSYTNGEFEHEHMRTELSPAPSAVGQSYVTRYLKRVPPVRTTADVLRIPDEFEDLLMLAVSRRLAAFRGEAQDDFAYEQRFRQRVKELKAWQNRQPGRLRGQRRLVRTSSRWPY